MRRREGRVAAIRILIAEDNDLVSLTMEEQLKGLGYDVVGAVGQVGPGL